MVAACALTMSNSSEQSASGIDFTENEEVKVVICQDNSAAVTTTRRSQRNIGKKPRRYNIYSETDTSNDSFSSNSSTESPTKKKSLSAKSQVKVISPKRGPGRPRKNHDSELQRNISSPITTRPNVQLNQPTGKPPLMPVKSLRLKFSFDSGAASAPVNTTPIRRGPGRPRKNPSPLDNVKSSPVNGQSARHNDTKEAFVTPRTKRAKTSSNSEESTLQITPKMPEKPKTPLDIIREEHVKERVDSLVQVVEEHDSLVRELYYMESYNMLMWDLDPQRINSDNSERMVKYLENHNLWSSLNDQVTNSIQSNSTRMSTRRSLNKHRDSILNMLQQSIGSRVFHNVMASEHTSGDSDSGSRTHRRSSRVDSTNNRDNASSGGMSLYSLRKRGHAQFPSFEAYLESFVTLDDEDITPAEEEAKLQSEIDVDYRIWVLKNQGKLQPIPKPATEPPRQKTHWDYILDGVIAKSKRINKSSDERLRKTHQISRAVLGHFNKLAMKEPNAIKAEEKRIKKLAKTTGNLIKQRWREISKFINDMHDKLVAEEEERRGKQKLNALFEDATQKIEFHEKYLMGTASTDNTIVNKTNEDDNNNQESGADVNSFDNDQMSIDEDLEIDYPLDFNHDDDLSTDPDMSEMALDQNVEDDEASLEAQELEEDSEEEAVELNDLADEMNLPIDELLKRYGVNKQSEEENEDTDRSDEIKPVLNGTTNRDLKKNHLNLSLYDSDDDSFSELETSTQSSNTTKTRTPIPSLLRGQLRAYQHDGLHWLASLYEQRSNGILADEMGLGKTIQTIALLAHLACDKGVWGPHLIIVPTSVIINWEMEFKKWCPGFIILTYYGSPKERKEKRLGWSKEHSFHVCITSYHLAVQDAINFRKKRWHYLILDEAHNIKNFKSQRWNTLLNFNSERRLLLTGTPLQNNLMELWSLLYFLKPNVRNDDMPFEYANQKEFQDWFSRPVDKMIENNEGFDEKTRTAILTLHTLLRPYLLRRLKIDVEKQLPAKHTHIIKCRLSKRQRFLYDDFMSRSKTKETLRSGNFLSIINCLMQLRKVCNHPDLFEVRPIVTSFAMSRSAIRDYEYCEMTLRNRLNRGNDYLKMINFDLFNLLPIYYENMDWLASSECNKLDSDNLFIEKLNLYNSRINNIVEEISYYSLSKFGNVMQNRAHIESLERWKHMRYINSFRLKRRPIYGTGLINICRQLGISPFDQALMDSKNPRKYLEHTNTLPDMVVSYERRYGMMEEIIKKYAFVTPAVVAADVRSYTLSGLPEEFQHIIHNHAQDLYYPIRVKLMIAFPDKRLLQYDCGKLQELDRLLRNLKEKGHRALIFTQMTRVLDILEIFLNIHGHRYLRLDGATKIEQRQLLTERFNNDPRILVFILSTRSGGLGINLTGADTVIFYDIDWNPCMDRQCQDRCHRIGQTREVNIYRFVCEATIEENMLAKAQQKEMLDKMVITDGGFTTDFWSQPKVDWRDIVKVIAPDHDKEINDEPESGVELEQCLAKVEDDTDVNAAEIAKKEMESDLIEFDENAVTPAESSGGAENSSVALVRRESTVSTAPSPLNENYDDDNLKSHLLPVELYMFRFMEFDLDKYVGFGRTFEYNSTEDINNEE